MPRKSEPSDRFLTVPEVAERYRSTPDGIYQQRSRGQAPGALGLRVGARLLFRLATLLEWEAAGCPANFEPKVPVGVRRASA